jgi:alcohol dehydrogenase
MNKFHMPSRLIMGKDCLVESGDMIKNHGSKAFIVTGKSSAEKSGALADLKSLLERNKISYVVCSEIRENPELNIVHKAAGIMREERCDLIIGVGGGSPIDAAKAISIIAANDLTGREIYEPEKIQKAFPIVSITTTSGTGTEATPYSVITDTELNKKAGFGNPLIFPVLSFLDPVYTMTMPEKVTKDTAVDALSHLLEGIYSRSRCEFLFPLIAEGIKMIWESLPFVIHDPEDYVHREQLMTASLYGGMVIAQSSTTLQHSIGYPLTTNFGLSHGLANGVVMKEIMQLFFPEVEPYLTRLFDHLGIAAADLFEFLEEMGMKCDLDLSTEFIATAAEEISQSRNMSQNPREVSVGEIRGILERISS